VRESADSLLELRGITKRFGAVVALDGVDLAVPSGAVTALCGDNGAGKSVLVKCIAGIHTPDAGEIRWHGETVRIDTPKAAARLGIDTVFQDLALCNNLDVVENMYLGRELVRGIVLQEEPMELAALRTLSDLSVTTIRSVRQPVGSMSGGQRQSIAVARAVMWNSELVIMDEPTAALGVAQTRQVLELVRSLAGRGLGVLMISHNLNDVFQVADRIAVLHLGRMVAEGDVGQFDRESVVDHMTTGTSTRGATPTPPQPIARMARTQEQPHDDDR
jgi:ABC-type sugar transport system ATPase subunit